MADIAVRGQLVLFWETDRMICIHTLANDPKPYKKESGWGFYDDFNAKFLFFECLPDGRTVSLGIPCNLKKALKCKNSAVVMLVDPDSYNALRGVQAERDARGLPSLTWEQATRVIGEFELVRVDMGDHYAVYPAYLFRRLFVFGPPEPLYKMRWQWVTPSEGDDPYQTSVPVVRTVGTDPSISLQYVTDRGVKFGDVQAAHASFYDMIGRSKDDLELVHTYPASAGVDPKRVLRLMNQNGDPVYFRIWAERIGDDPSQVPPPKEGGLSLDR